MAALPRLVPGEAISSQTAEIQHYTEVMAAASLPRLTPEQYLKIEREADVKSEYINGEMFAMSGGTLPHAILSSRLIGSLQAKLDSGACTIVGSDLRVRVAVKGPFFYPDLTIYCGQPELADDHRDTLLNPMVIFEVLSKSSEAYGRGLKFAHYRSIPSMRDYVLISQTEPRIEVFSRMPDGKWTLTEFVGLEVICQIPAVHAEIALRDICRDISFDIALPDPPPLNPPA